ncbi:WD40 repeat-like protein [Exidia glandulosa HHB12029]|uniref:WD40 repeat-like protein n=1 Tax=Exidia glandulosa HHB12029 TaxID=1314781 RepID=A0A165JWF3_EXIGL|nr:WD40 repeat-like protein [Exidia glandulosa HHB12029]
MSTDAKQSHTTAHQSSGAQAGEPATDSTLPASTSPPDITLQVRDASSRPVAFGGYADIYSGTWDNGTTEMKVAIKVLRIRALDPGGELLLRQIRRELSVWKRLSHPNIQVLCGRYEGIGPASAMVSPWCQNGDINAYIAARAADPNIETLKFNLVFDILNGLGFLHDHSIVHGDIKGGNILIDDDGTARLCDFGLSRLLAKHSQSITNTTSVKGTFRWMAPELLLDGGHHTYKSDMWAVGCLLLEIWAGLPPYFTADSDQQVLLAMWRKEVPYPTRPVDVDVIVWAQIENCCIFEPTTRPSPGHIVENLRVLRLIIPRVTSLVRRGDPRDADILLLAAVTTSLSFGESKLTDLAAMVDHDFAIEVVRVFLRWSLAIPRDSRLYTNETLYRWCLDNVRHSEAHPLSNPDVSTGEAVEDDDDSLIIPSKLRPFAILLAAVDPSYADVVMLRFARASIGTPICFDAEGRTYPQSVVWFPDCDRIAVGLIGGTVDIFSTSSDATIRRLNGHEDHVMQVAISPDGRLLASCSYDRTIRLWDAETGNAVGEPMLGHTSHVFSVAFSPDGTHIASASKDKTIRIWSCETRDTVVGPLYGHTSSVFSAAYSPDASRIVSGSWDKTIRVWDTQTGACILGPLSGHGSMIFSVAFSPDGLRFVSGSYDKTVRIWDAFSGEPVGEPIEGHRGGVHCVAYSPDGARIASGSWDHTIRISDAATGALIHQPLRGHTHAVVFVAFSPDGRKLVSASHDVTVRIWDATDEWTRWDI